MLDSRCHYLGKSPTKIELELKNTWVLCLRGKLLHIYIYIYIYNALKSKAAMHYCPFEVAFAKDNCVRWLNFKAKSEINIHHFQKHKYVYQAYTTRKLTFSDKIFCH